MCLIIVTKGSKSLFIHFFHYKIKFVIFFFNAGGSWEIW
jgi:hypothetical protein